VHGTVLYAFRIDPVRVLKPSISGLLTLIWCAAHGKYRNAAWRDIITALTGLPRGCQRLNNSEVNARALRR
jgi:hypothetical protein